MNMLALVLSAALLASPIAPGGDASGSASAAPPEAALAARADGPQLLFYPIPEAELVRGTTVAFDIGIDGASVAREVLAVAPRPAEPGAAVEVLAWHPAAARQVHAAARAGRQVTVQVGIGGVPVETLDLAQLVERTRGLLETGLRPVPTAPAAASARGPEARGSLAGTFGFLGCLSQCDEDWHACQDGCLPRPVPTCQRNCDRRHDLCRAACHCPTWTDRTDIEHIRGDLTGRYGCFFPRGVPEGYLFAELQSFRKHTTVRRTEHCDGTVTEEVIDVVYVPGPLCFTRQHRDTRPCEPVQNGAGVCFFDR